MTFLQRKKQQNTDMKNRVISRDSTEQWINNFKQKYYEVKEVTEHFNFEENMALYCFLYMYLHYEFEEASLCDKIKHVKKYLDWRVFSSSNPKKILKDIDHLIQML